MDRHRAIGRHNTLPWHLPDDLKRFKALTSGKPVLMGRKTAQSLGRALPKRHNLVLTRSGQVPFSSMQPVDSLAHALSVATDNAASELWIIGGAQVYTLCLPYASGLYLTHVDTEVENPDTWFPEWDTTQWQAAHCLNHPADANHPIGFRCVDYKKVINV